MIANMQATMLDDTTEILYWANDLVRLLLQLRVSE